MTAFEPFLKAFVKDVAVKLTEQFDRNFERKAFFDKKWPQTRWPNAKGSLMMRTGTLRGSLKSKVTNSTIHFSSSLPYAALHNEGGTITVTNFL